MLCNGFDVASVKDHRSLRLAYSLLERLRRDPKSHYRALRLHELSLKPDATEQSEELDELEYLGWTPDTYAQKEILDAILSLRHVIITFMSSFGKKGKGIDAPEPSYRPGQHTKQKSAAPAPKSGTTKTPTAAPKKTYAGKVITIADMDDEFFANHKTEYS